MLSSEKTRVTTCVNPPTGIGMWITYQGLAIMGGDFQTLAIRLSQLGVQWLAIRAGQSERTSDWSRPRAKECIFWMREKGIRVYPWWYSLPTTTTKQLAMVDTLLEDGADGLIINAEIEWESLKHEWHHLARRFAREVKDRAGERYVGHAPFGWAPLHANAFPYKEFGEELDGTHPQLYWTELRYGKYEDMMDKAVPWWDEHEPRYSPVGVTYGKGSALAAKVPGKFEVKHFEAFLDRFKDKQSISFYSYDNADKSCLSLLAHYKQAADIAGQGVINRVKSE